MNVWIANCIVCLFIACSCVGAAQELAFPGAEGWAAHTPGGRGGKIIRVTTLAPTGQGSFLEALNTKGPRIIVFEVGGVIDLDKQKVTIKEPFLTIAGQTAPSPGITFIRNGIFVQAHDVVIRHIRVRPGAAGHPKKSGWDVDGITCADGARDVIIDHCSLTWATDENADIWGPPFKGDTPEEWHANNVQRITYSRNIIAEGLNDSANGKGPHSKGMLIGDNTSSILVIGNLFASNLDRNPEVKGGVYAAMVNNYIFNPGLVSALYHMTEKRWKGHEYIHGKLDLVGNVMRHGPDTLPQLTLLRFVGNGDLELHAEDNLAFDREGRPFGIITEDNRYGGKILPRKDHAAWPDGLQPLPAARVEEEVLSDAGARPWERDEVDQRIIRQVRDRAGRIIDSETQGGGYPAPAETRAPFREAEWDLSVILKKPGSAGR